MNKIKNASIKLLLSIPAIIIGIISYFTFIIKYSQSGKLLFGPIYKLWFNEELSPPLIEPPSISQPNQQDLPQENHKFY